MRPLVAVSKTAHLAAEGNLAARVQLNLRGKNEITLLLPNFNALADSLEKLEAERKTTTATIAHELRTIVP
jgi:two-component system, OmpR family, sensor histidine kinase BaeS